MVVFDHVKHAKAAKESLQAWRQQDSTVPEVYYGLPSQYERSLWKQEEDELFGAYKGRTDGIRGKMGEHKGVYALKDRTTLVRRNYETHPKTEEENARRGKWKFGYEDEEQDGDEDEKL